MMDQKLKANYNPISDYKDTFHPIEGVATTKRGLAVPAHILTKLDPCQCKDNLSMTRKDFVEKPMIGTKAFSIPKGNILSLSGATFQDATTYQLNYPWRKFKSNPMAQSLMRTTLPQIVEVSLEDNYATTNKQSHKEWNGNYRSVAYKELQEEPIFVGNIQTKSLTRNDFSSIEGKPSTSYKKVEPLLENGDFDETTTHNTVYKIPALPQKRVLFSKTQSKDKRETPIPKQDGAEFMIFHRDRFELPKSSVRRSICQPEPDKLSLFSGNFDHKTENKSSFIKHNKVPHVRESFKNSQVISKNPMEGVGGKFYDQTTTNLHFQPVSCHVQASGVRNTRDTLLKVSENSKGSQRIRESQDFGVGANSKTINQSEYFKFWKVPTREIHGDKTERVYYPCKSKFDMKSETKSTFKIKEGKPAEPFMPLNQRFQKTPVLNSRKMASETSYKNDFVCLPLPKPATCFAAQFLQQAC